MAAAAPSNAPGAAATAAVATAAAGWERRGFGACSCCARGRPRLPKDSRVERPVERKAAASGSGGGGLAGHTPWGQPGLGHIPRSTGVWIGVLLAASSVLRATPEASFLAWRLPPPAPASHSRGPQVAPASRLNTSAGRSWMPVGAVVWSRGAWSANAGIGQGEVRSSPNNTTHGSDSAARV